MNKKMIWSLIAVLLAVMTLTAGCQKSETDTAPVAETTPEVVDFVETTDEPAADVEEEPVAAAEETVEATEETVEAGEETSEAVQETAGEETVQATVEVPAADTLLCTINGKQLTYGDIAPYIQSILSMYVNEYGLDSTDAQLVKYSNQGGMYFAQQYVILDELGAELSVGFTDEEMEEVRTQALTSWGEIIAYYEETYYGISEASTEDEKNAARTGTLAMLESMGYTEDSYVTDEMTAARYEKILAAVCKDVEVTNTELDEYIDGLVKADQEMYAGEDVSYYEMMKYYGYPTYYRPDGYRAVTHILLKVDTELMNTYSDLTARFEEQQNAAEATEPTEGAEVSESAEPETTEEPVTTEQIEAARQAILASVQPTVDEIIEKFNAGTPFADLVAEYGTDPGMQQEGALETGYEVAATSMMWDIPFRDAAMSIESIGGVSAPVVGANGVHIVYYLKDIPGGPVEITDAERESIRNEILSERQNELLDSTIMERLNAAEITYTDEAAPYIPVLEEETAGEEASTVEEVPVEEAAVAE